MKENLRPQSNLFLCVLNFVSSTYRDNIWASFEFILLIFLLIDLLIKTVSGEQFTIIGFHGAFLFTCTSFFLLAYAFYWDCLRYGIFLLLFYSDSFSWIFLFYFYFVSWFEVRLSCYFLCSFPSFILSDKQAKEFPFLICFIFFNRWYFSIQFYTVQYVTNRNNTIHENPK